MTHSTPRILLWAIVLSLVYALRSSAQSYSITDYIVSGTGCPAGTVDAAISPSGTSLSLAFSSFIANAGGSYTASYGRRNCQLTLDVEVPAGYQFSINNASYSGSYSLANSNTTATYTTTTYFQASLDQSTGSKSVKGPRSASNTVLNTLSPAVWSPCGKSSLVNVNSVVRLSGTNKSGQVVLDSLDLSEDSFIWRAC